MARYQQRQRPMSISSIHMNLDDMERLPGAEYTSYSPQAYTFNETGSSESHPKRDRCCFIAVIIIFILIAVLSITGLIIAIYSLVLSTNKAQTITTSTESVTETSTATCSSSPTTYYEYATGTPSQCLNYTLNTDATRNIGYTSSIDSCDDVSPFTDSTPIWIRFQAPAGNLIANSPVTPSYCGAVVTGWYAGQYPSALFTTATSIVCFYYTTNTCYACSSISITKCHDFYVFLLPATPACNYRYCTL